MGLQSFSMHYGVRQKWLSKHLVTLLLLLLTISLFLCDPVVVQGGLWTDTIQDAENQDKDNDLVGGDETTLVDMMNSLRQHHQQTHNDDNNDDNDDDNDHDNDHNNDDNDMEGTGSFPTAPKTPVPSLEKGIEPPLPTWYAVQQQLLKAKCASRVHRFLSSSTSPSSSSSLDSDWRSIPAVCRRPIAVIITNPETEHCPSCLLFSLDLLSPGKSHLATLQALRDTQVSVVLHVARPGGISGEDDDEDETEKKWGDHHLFSETIRRHPVPSPIEEDWQRLLPLDAATSCPCWCNDSAAGDDNGVCAGGSCEARRRKRWLAGIRAVREYWKQAREHSSFRQIWKRSYAGEGEYALRVLFLWPHNGSVMPIVNPEWALYAGQLRKREQTPPAGKNWNNDEVGGGAEGEEEGADERSSHLYISAKDFLRNCVLAWEMVNELFQI